MDIQNLSRIFKAHSKPAPFEKSRSQEDFWDNAHISKMMLLAHLNPNWDAASRKPETIDATCAFILKTLNLSHKEALLDLGCGPGLYCQRFYQEGLRVTGVDYSRRSLDYAIEQAELLGLSIDYHYMDYLEIDFKACFDVVTLIYCDFGVLSYQDRTTLLEKIHQSLRPGGYFVFDVWSTAYSDLTAQYKNWKIHDRQGFWKPTPHLELIHKDYDADLGLSLEQHIIIEEDAQISVYHLWEQCYTVESIQKLLMENGFEVIQVLGDLTGRPYEATSKSIGIIARVK